MHGQFSREASRSRRHGQINQLRLPLRLSCRVEPCSCADYIYVTDFRGGKRGGATAEQSFWKAWVSQRLREIKTARDAGCADAQDVPAVLKFGGSEKLK